MMRPIPILAALALFACGVARAQHMPPDPVFHLPPDPVLNLPPAPEWKGDVKAGPDGRPMLVPRAPAPAQPRTPAVQQAGIRPAPPGPLVPRVGNGPDAPAAPVSVPPAVSSEIVLPSPFALELPPGDVAAAADSPGLVQMLGTARAGSLALTHKVPAQLPLGVVPVTFTAWTGAAGDSAIAATRTAPLLLLPFGQAPAGASRSDRATGANNAPKIVHDDSGVLHMVWLDVDGGDGGTRVMYRRGLPADDGGIRWDGPATALSTGMPTSWNAYPSIVTMPGGVLIAWQSADKTVVLRHVSRGANGWDLGAPMRTAMHSDGREAGPSLAAPSAHEVLLLLPSGEFARSADDGAHWTTELLPLPAGAKAGNATMAIDPRGNAHIVFIAEIDDTYTQLRYVRRSYAGIWSDAQDILADQSGWLRPNGGEQVIADRPSILIDPQGGLLVAWQGTARTRRFGQEEAFLRYRLPEGTSALGAWHEVQVLWTPPARGVQTFAPVLSYNSATRSAVALAFADIGDNSWETIARRIDFGATSGEPLHVSQIGLGPIVPARSIWFPSVVPQIRRSSSGRAWLDVLETMRMPAGTDAPNVIVMQSAEITSLLGGRKTASR